MRPFGTSAAGLGLVLGLTLPLARTASADVNGLPDGPELDVDDTVEIIGGTLAPAGKWPDTVAILGPTSACSGTLIAPDVVLTAGHCAGSMTRVIANTTDYTGNGGQVATIKSMTAYPNWQSMYDVSVIVLNTPITGVTPRPIGTSCTFAEFSAKPQIQLVGFGLTDTAAAGNNTKLYEVAVGVTDPTCTRSGVGCKAAIAGGEFIAGGAGKDSCNGDSGGPAYLNTPRGWVVVGVVSRGFDNSQTPCGGGGIYVRTDPAPLLGWIESTTGKKVSQDNCTAGPTNPNNPTNPDPNNPTGDDDNVTGGCSTSGSGAGLLLGLLALVRRRRRS